MILVNLKGGLGNQMFQYACGRAIALRRALTGKRGILKLDATGYERSKGSDTPRSYRLGAFKIAATLATPEEIRPIKYPLGPLSMAWRLFRAKVLDRHYTQYFDSIAKKLPAKESAYLDGYFQSEKYFKEFEPEIRAEFSLKEPLSKAAQAHFDKISRDPYAVSLHVRRGDYANDKATNAFWGTCDADYYRRAVEEIVSALPKPNLYVFSDDIEWVKKNLDFGLPMIPVSSPELADFEELVLMSACRHNVIANSSFSWWGAWLNANPGKTVIAPVRWSNVHNDDWYKDIIPDTWKRL